MDDDLSLIQDALNRMKRAYDRGTGVHIPAHMLQALGLSFLGQTWEDQDPGKRKPPMTKPNEPEARGAE